MEATFPDFLVKAPLYKKVTLITNAIGGFHIQSSSGFQAIHDFCETCKCERTFAIAEQPGLIHQFEQESLPKPLGSLRSSLGDAYPEIYIFHYECSFCKKMRRIYCVWFDERKKQCMKVGQIPAVGISVDKQLQTMLREHASDYKKGLICESQGYGIGAYAYYRRIVELVIDELLTSITELMDGEERVKYSEALEATKSATNAREKIDLVKPILPPFLTVQYNPLGVLYRVLSEGIHAMDDEDCLDKAGAIRETLVLLIDQIAVHKRSRTLPESVKKLLDGRERKQK